MSPRELDCYLPLTRLIVRGDDRDIAEVWPTESTSRISFEVYGRCDKPDSQVDELVLPLGEQKIEIVAEIAGIRERLRGPSTTIDLDCPDSSPVTRVRQKLPSTRKA